MRVVHFLPNNGKQKTHIKNIHVGVDIHGGGILQGVGYLFFETAKTTEI